MKTIFFMLFTILAVMNTFSQNIVTERQPIAAGTFYPADKETLTRDIAALFKNCKKTPDNWKVRAIVSPHAGYVFSGKIAAAAFSTIPSDAVYKNIFIIGSSHVMAFDGASVYNTGDYLTPLGKVPVNRDIANKLIKDNKVFNFATNPHIKEHSIEVQLPLMQYYFKNLPLIVPIIIGSDNESTIKKIAEALRPWFTPENLFVISSDFSHYPPYKEAIESDRSTAEAIATLDPKVFLNVLKKNSAKHIQGLVTSMCGWTSGLALIYLAENNKELEFKLIDYCNSGDSSYGSKDEVVGYNAMALVESDQKSSGNEKSEIDFSFTRKETDQLFAIARNSIRTMLYDKKRIVLDKSEMPPKFFAHMGAFVTLKINGVLRGCIGRFISEDPLYEVVQASALSSAFEDPRFPALTKSEYDKTDVEITVLGPLKKINNINEIILGKHGIYIKKDNRAGTMLPQVATENGWTVEEFLGYTSRDKAGIGWDGWKDADLYIYEGVVLEENRK